MYPVQDIYLRVLIYISRTNSVDLELHDSSANGGSCDFSL